MKVVRVVVSRRDMPAVPATDSESRRAMAEAALWLAHAMLPESGGSISGGGGAELRTIQRTEASRPMRPEILMTSDAQKV